MSEKEATGTIVEVAKALRYMHEEKHMLHLDLKPGNIMRRNSDGHLFLIDFGLSKHYREDGVPETSTSVGLGTPGYAPIEQANIKTVKQFKRTLDIYSLGATFYKLLTGNIPPSADELVSDKDIIQEELKKITDNEIIVSTIINAMSPSIKERTQTVSAFLSNLRGEDENVRIVNVEDLTDWQQDNSFEKQANKEQVDTHREIRKRILGKPRRIYIYVICGLFLIFIALLFFFNRRNYSQDYSIELVEAATGGDKLAQYWLGNCFHLGRGVSINYDEAFKWYMKSAEQGFDSAQIKVAHCYSEAEGVEQDFTKALSWINKAVEQNNADAINSLGDIYMYGDGVKADTIKALELYRKSAKKGSSDGMVSLGWSYLLGNGVRADTTEALKWFQNAQEINKYSASKFWVAYYRGKYGDNRDSTKCIQMLMDKLEHARDTYNIRNTYCLIAEFYELSDGFHKNEKEAFRWFNKAAGLGSAEGMYWTGMSYIWGNTIQKDSTKAFYWINKCANLDRIPWRGKDIGEASRQYKEASYEVHCIIESQRTLSGLFYYGDGVKQSFDKYIYWLKTAANNGSYDAQHSLGHIYKDGFEKIPKDLKEAYKWFNYAVENGHGEACVDMAFAYFEGRERYKKNDKEGIKYLELGASRKDPLATFDLGIMYYNGENGLSVDKIKAKQYLLKAQELGYERAGDAIKDLF